MLPTQVIQDLSHLQDDPYQHIEIEGYGSQVLQILDLQIHDLDMIIFHDLGLGYRLEVPEEVDLIHLAQLGCMVLHPRRATDVPIHKHSDTLH